MITYEFKLVGSSPTNYFTYETIGVDRNKFYSRKKTAFMATKLNQNYTNHMHQHLVAFKTLHQMD